MADSVATYAYSRAYSPPAPVIEVEAQSPGRAQPGRRLLALVDSGADATLIPIDVLEDVGARYVGDAVVRGLMGERHTVDVYLVNLTIGSHAIRAVRAIAAAEGAELILGRNTLNHLTITLNGPAGVTEIAA